VIISCTNLSLKIVESRGFVLYSTRFGQGVAISDSIRQTVSRRCSPSFGPKFSLLKVDRCLQYSVDRSLLLACGNCEKAEHLLRGSFSLRVRIAHDHASPCSSRFFLLRASMRRCSEHSSQLFFPKACRTCCKRDVHVPAGDQFAHGEVSSCLPPPVSSWQRLRAAKPRSYGFTLVGRTAPIS
jgi:hypothetical protein